MIRRFPACRAVLTLALTGALPVLLLGCPKKPVPEVVEAAPPPAPVDAAPTQLAPLDDDAGIDAAVAAPTKHGGGKADPSANLKACCNGLRTQAKAMGTSPEANTLLSYATQCDALAVAAMTGNAPELAIFKQLLAGRPIPPVCKGF